MRVGIACDHVGFAVKAAVIEALEQDEHAVLDLGTHGAEATDYAPFARAVAAAVLKNFVDHGIVLCASGIGAAIVANRIPSIRAAAAGDPATARESREHIDTNVLAIAAGGLEPDAVVAIVKSWAGAQFSATEPAVAALKLIEDTAAAVISRRVAPAPANGAAASPTAASAAHITELRDETPPPPVEAVRPSDITAVMKVIAAVTDPEIKGIATRVLQFIRNRFPTAIGTPTDDGFTFSLGGEHVATVVIAKNYVEMEAGPDRLGTGKLRDVERLDLLLGLPSMSKAFDALKT